MIHPETSSSKSIRMKKEHGGWAAAQCWSACQHARDPELKAKINKKGKAEGWVNGFVGKSNMAVRCTNPAGRKHGQTPALPLWDAGEILTGTSIV